MRVRSVHLPVTFKLLPVAAVGVGVGNSFATAGSAFPLREFAIQSNLLVARMIEVARWAPSGFHSQPWELVAIRDKRAKDKIAAAVNAAPPAPAMRDDTDPGHPRLQRGFADAPVSILLAG